ncbi:MAG: hypothetical protein LBI03_07495, partial [Clostridiales bacterium]|nr:hypothetical protein [Clostridiales bacterium]
MKTLNTRQREMAEKNHGLIISFIRKKRLNFDDVYGDLAETYCNAIASYDEKKALLSTYVLSSLENKMKNIYRVRTYRKTIPDELIVSIDEPVSVRNDSPTHAELIADYCMNIENEIQLKMDWEQIYKEFSQFELEVLDNIICRDHTQEQL